MLLIASLYLAKQSRKVRYVMATPTTKSQVKTELLDQMLEDLAGEEFSEFDDDFELSPDLDKFSDIDDFAEIDNFH